MSYNLSFETQPSVLSGSAHCVSHLHADLQDGLLRPTKLLLCSPYLSHPYYLLFLLLYRGNLRAEGDPCSSGHLQHQGLQSQWDSHVCSLTVLVVSFWDTQEPFQTFCLFKSSMQLVDDLLLYLNENVDIIWHEIPHCRFNTHFRLPALVLPTALSSARRAAPRWLSYTKW